MIRAPWYDPKKSYNANFDAGPAGDFTVVGSPSALPYMEVPMEKYTFFGKPLRFPFGIPAGPLLNSAYVIAALDAGFDVPVYKTVRTRTHACHPYPNVLPVDVDGD